MEQRKVRVPAYGVRVLLGEATGELVNMSVSGALMRLDRCLPVGEPHRLTIVLDSEHVVVQSKVTRHTALSGADAPEAKRRWLLAVSFVDVTPLVIKALRGVLVELHKRASEPRRTSHQTPVLR